jgi:hypothetical protein
MLGKLLFHVGAFTSAWVGLVLMFSGYAVPGVIVLGFGYTMFCVVYIDE